MTLRTDKERLWKPCKDCGIMMKKYSKGPQTCGDCKKKNRDRGIRRSIFGDRWRKSAKKK